MPSSPPVLNAVGERATAAAAAAAMQAGVVVTELATSAATKTAAELFAEIWHTMPGTTPISSDLMRALHEAGNYVAGAYAEDVLVAASVGFFTGDPTARLHSHIAGVAARVQGRHVGFALKVHQRAWALSRGVEQISWTVDPLVRRNVFFNLRKLGAEPQAYLPDFYGSMEDGVNGDDESDRLLLSWNLGDERVARACERGHVADSPADGAPVAVALDVGPDGGPVVGEVDRSSRFACRLPVDIVDLRAAQPGLARAWRQALRATLGTAVQDGARVIGFSREGGYLLSRTPA